LTLGLTAPKQTADAHHTAAYKAKQKKAIATRKRARRTAQRRKARRLVRARARRASTRRKVRRVASARRASKRRASKRRATAAQRRKARRLARVAKRRATQRRKAARKARTSKRRVASRKPEGRIFRSTQRVSVAAYRGKVRGRAPGTVLRGMASYYWQPQPLASGGRFNPNALTAAHKTLPFGTRVRVKNLNNGRTVTVVINDRGPYIRGRIIDLSKRAAGVVGMQGSGVAPVLVTVLGRGKL
ncbi:MAG: septal ring lytic transglycosylase RlpA family protein, partial [Pseudomonadota bacterium]